MARTMLFVLIGVAVASLAALAWRIGRPIEVPDMPAPERQVAAPATPATEAPPRASRPPAAPSLSAQEEPPPRAFGNAPLSRGREALGGITSQRFGRFRKDGATPSGHLDPAIALQMDEANQYYERGQYAEAKEQALRVLSIVPEHPRMLRVVVGAACMLGDAATAQSHFEQLERPRDREQLAARCREAGLELTP